MYNYATMAKYNKIYFPCIAATTIEVITTFDICGFHGNDYEDCCYLEGCDAM
jgi:hypothetical protein